MTQTQTAADWATTHGETLEIDLGAQWTLGAQRWPRWRVSWIEATGELYAHELGGQGRYAVLGHCATRAEAEAALAHDPLWRAA